MDEGPGWGGKSLVIRGGGLRIQILATVADRTGQLACLREDKSASNPPHSMTAYWLQLVTWWTKGLDWQESLSNSWRWSTHTDPDNRGQNGWICLWKEDKSGSLSKMETNLGDGHIRQFKYWRTLIFSTQGYLELHVNFCFPQLVVLGNWKNHNLLTYVCTRCQTKYRKTTLPLTNKGISRKGLHSSPVGNSAEASSSGTISDQWGNRS